jgi:hypothetical protein
MLSKYLASFGPVYYNSFEQGHSKSLQDAFKRQGMEEVKGGITIGHKEKWPEMLKRLDRKKSPHTVVIDSLQYVPVSYNMWQQLRERYPKKRFLLISHAANDTPEGYHAKKIQFDVDIKVLVKYYRALPKCRFGGNEPFMIYQEGYERWMRELKKSPPVVVESPQAD